MMRKIGLCLAFLTIIGIVGTPGFDDVASAQCLTTNTQAGTLGGTRVQVNKLVSFTPSVTCNLTHATHTTINGQPCWPLSTMISAGYKGNFFARRQMTDIQTRTCQWNCGVCTITIDQSHGLPVELMEFAIEEGGEGSDPDDRS